MLEIYNADIVDCEAIIALQHLSYQSEAKIYQDWSLPALTQTVESLVGEFASSVILKAVIEGNIIGSVRATMSGGVARIARLIVHPEFQGQGIGSKLLNAIEQICCQVEKFELFTGTKSLSNIKFYQRHGYAISHTQMLSDNLCLVFLVKNNMNC